MIIFIKNEQEVFHMTNLLLSFMGTISNPQMLQVFSSNESLELVSATVE